MHAFFGVILILATQSFGFKPSLRPNAMGGRVKSKKIALYESNDLPGQKNDFIPLTGSEKISQSISKLGQSVVKIAAMSSLTSFAFSSSKTSAAVRSYVDESFFSLSLPKLPYAYEALEPYVSERTLHFHHDKHHGKYVNTTKGLIEGTSLEGSNLLAIMKATQPGAENANSGVYNNAAQCFNHAFYWRCMKPSGGGKADGKVAQLIDRDFGSFDKFKEQFAQAGNSQFGSGWAWLVLATDPNTKAQQLKIMKTANAENPLTLPNLKPILTMDVWEHAYYLDYQNLRASYVDAFLTHLVDWKFVNSQLTAYV